jgi:hypothetical protein
MSTINDKNELVFDNDYECQFMEGLKLMLPTVPIIITEPRAYTNYPEKGIRICPVTFQEQSIVNPQILVGRMLSRINNAYKEGSIYIRTIDIFQDSTGVWRLWLRIAVDTNPEEFADRMIGFVEPIIELKRKSPFKNFKVIT